jgi:hypothetical protein
MTLVFHVKAFVRCTESHSQSAQQIKANNNNNTTTTTPTTPTTTTRPPPIPLQLLLVDRIVMPQHIAKDICIKRECHATEIAVPCLGSIKYVLRSDTHTHTMSAHVD